MVTNCYARYSSPASPCIGILCDPYYWGGHDPGHGTMYTYMICDVKQKCVLLINYYVSHSYHNLYIYIYTARRLTCAQRNVSLETRVAFYSTVQALRSLPLQLA